MRDGFALFDNQGLLVVWNPQYPLLLGLAANDLQRGIHYQQLLGQAAPLAEHIRDNLPVPLPNPRSYSWRATAPLSCASARFPGGGW
jgi:PAS domain-containing protein